MKSDAVSKYAYEAFISYRHKPLDGKVAKVIHGLIENYKLPKQLLKEGYPKTFKKVFRDREELPVSPDLSSSIDIALRAAKYIFVICSLDTPFSKWVEQEILTFITLKRCDYIIPVLIDGDVDISFPEPLKKLYYEDTRLFEGKIIDLRSVSTKGVISNLNSKRTKIISLLLDYDYKKFDEMNHKHLTKKALKKTLFVIIPLLFFGAVNFAGLYFSETYAGKMSEKNVIISRINSDFLNEYISVFRTSTASAEVGKEIISENMATLGENSVEMIEQHIFMGDLCTDLNELETAEEQYKKAFNLVNYNLLKKNLDTEKEIYLELYIKLGFLLLLKGDLESAQLHYNKARALCWDILTAEHAYPRNETLHYREINYYLAFIDYEMVQTSTLNEDISRLDDLTLYTKEQLLSVRNWKRYNEREKGYEEDLYYLAYQDFYRRECHKFFGDNQSLKTDLIQEIDVREEILIKNEKDIANGLNLAWCYEMLQGQYNMESKDTEAAKLKEKEFALRIKLEKLLEANKQVKSYENYIFCSNGAYLKENQLSDTGEYYRLGTIRELNSSYNHYRIADYYYKNNDMTKAEEEYLKAINLSEQEAEKIKFKNSKFWYEINNQRLNLSIYTVFDDQKKYDKILELCTENREKISELQKQLSKESYIYNASANNNLQYIDQCHLFFLSKSHFIKGDNEKAKVFCREGIESSQKLFNLTKSEQVKILLSFFNNLYSNILVKEKNYKESLSYANTACILNPQNEQFKKDLEELMKLR